MTEPPTVNKKDRKKAEKQAREARLQNALRENLKKRKRQAHAREDEAVQSQDLGHAQRTKNT